MGNNKRFLIMLIQMCHDEVTVLLVYSTWTQFVGNRVEMMFETEEYVEAGSEQPIAHFTTAQGRAMKSSLIYYIVHNVYHPTVFFLLVLF